ncbi:hypothetical protein Q8G41_28560, partial [Klebsiella pneumoniae]|uniref:hypothetical protein n=1 Tax=Klebsiella pneumoniae TaxID=573 RepID=UPI003013511A
KEEESIGQEDFQASREGRKASLGFFFFLLMRRRQKGAMVLFKWQSEMEREREMKEDDEGRRSR